jgi:hypothetical protein
MKAREKQIFRERSYFFYKENMIDALESDDIDPSEDECDEDFEPKDIDFLGTEDYDREVFNDKSIISG